MNVITTFIFMISFLRITIAYFSMLSVRIHSATGVLFKHSRPPPYITFLSVGAEPWLSGITK